MYKLLFSAILCNDRINKGVCTVSTIDNFSLVLVIIGALNWGSIGLFGFDFVAAIFGGQMSIVSRIIFTLVGIAGLWSITLLFKEKLPASTDR